MTNINSKVWRYVDNKIEIKKTLLEGLVNVSALARKIAQEEKLEGNIDAIISAIRRYETKTEKKDEHIRFSKLIRKAKLSTKTRLGSVLVRRTDETERKVSTIYSRLKMKRDSTLRIFEVINYIKIIIDDSLLESVAGMFSSPDIEKIEKNLGELTIDYSDDITKISGVFARISNELAVNEISIIDSMICQWEHLIIVKENDLEKAFTVIFSLTKG
ncbi:hypothetical protein JXA85_04590 [Candidatus Woesearchaeota archaeon]|nr:hypothetical protein [Candidatus Woesearchaeota archaeon]